MTETQMDRTKQPGITIDQIFVVEARFAHSQKALALPATTRIADLQFRLEARVSGKPGDRTAMVAVKAFTPDDADGLYSVLVDIAMMVTATQNAENLDPFEYARNMGPTALYPFVREAVASLTMKGRFGPLWLRPANLLAAPLVAADAVAQTAEIVEAPSA